jgi:hypothetical protein
MTSSNTLKKLVSIGAAMLLAVGGSLVAAEPAHASLMLDGFNTGTIGSPRVGDTKTFATILYADGGTPVTPTGSTYQWLTCTGTTGTSSAPTGCSNSTGAGSTSLSYTVVSLDQGKYLGLQIVSTFASYAPATNYLVSVVPVAAAPSVPAVTPGTPATSGLSDTGVTLNYSSDMVGNKAWSVREASSAAPTATYLGAWSWGAIDIKHGQGALMSSGSQTQAVTGLTAGTAYVAYLIVAGQYGNSNVQTFSFTTTGGSVVVATNPGSTAVVAESAKPLPVWAAPILKAIPTLSKTLNTDGGKVSLTDGDFSTLKTVTVGGKEVTFSTDAKGNVNIPIPAGAAGTTADLVVTFTGGKMVIQDGIKYVAPTDVAKVAEAGVAGFKANSSKVSGALAASILYAAQIDHKANAIACSGYAASKAQVALATARAQAACDYATGAYSNLTKSTVAVIVNKAKAKSASVGIKVYH